MVVSLSSSGSDKELKEASSASDASGSLTRINKTLFLPLQWGN